MDVLVVGEVTGMGGGVVVVAVVVAVVVVGAVIVVGVGIVVVVVVGDEAIVGGGRMGCIEAGWRGGTRGGMVEVGGVGVDDPTFGMEVDSRMGMFVDRGRSRKKRQRSDVVAGQGAWTAAYHYGREIAREGFDGAVVVDVSKLAVGSSFGRLDVEA